MNGKLLFLVAFVCGCAVAFRMPEFLDGVNEQDRQSYVKIVMNEQLSPEQKEAQVAALVKTQSTTVQQAFAKYQQERLAIKDQFGTSVRNEMNQMQQK